MALKSLERLQEVAFLEEKFFAINPLQEKTIKIKVVNSLGKPYDAKKIEFNGKGLKQVKAGEVEINVDEFNFGINKKDLPVYG